MPGPGGANQVNSLMDMMQPPQAADRATPPTGGTFGTYDPNAAYYMQPQVPLYSGGGPGALGMGGGGGGAVFSPPQELAQYFDPFGNPKIDDPRQVAADAGISLSQLAGGLLPRGSASDQRYEYPSDQGGFFRIEDLFGLTKRPVPVSGPGQAGGRPTMGIEQSVPVPSIAQFGMNAPSTNNWRLLGRGPGWIMRNGDLINTRDVGAISSGLWGGGTAVGSTTGDVAGLGSHLGRVWLGTGQAYGVPNLYAPGYAPAMAGWPGGGMWREVHPGMRG